MDRLEEAFQQLLLELTSKEILKDADPKSRKRSKPLVTKFQRFKGNIVTFATTSGTTPGKFWTQNVQLDALRKEFDKVREGKATLLQAVRAAAASDIRVHCNCPAQKWWGWAYISTQKGYKYGRKQTIYPSIRNPRLTGSVCKHLIKALGALPFNVPMLAKTARKQVVSEPVQAKGQAAPGARERKRT